MSAEGPDELRKLDDMMSHPPEPPPKRPRWAVTRTWKGSLAIAILWGISALFYWAAIVFKLPDEDWWCWIAAPWWTLSSLLYFNSARVLRKQARRG